MARPEFDAVIVGSGATGGWVAKELAEGGMSVLVLEAGRELSWADDVEPARARRAVADPTAWPDRYAVQSRHVSCQAHTCHLYVDDLDHPYSTPDQQPFDWIRGRQVGGRSVMWGRTTLRLSDHELRAGERDGCGGQWPLEYAELAPFYDKVERFHQVWGSPCDLPQAPGGQYVDRVPMTRGEVHLKQAIESRWPDRRVIHGRGIPEVALSSSTPWLAHTAQGSTLAAAAATGRMQLRANAIARRIVLDHSTGRAAGVDIVDRVTGQDEVVRGKLVVLCASTIETVRLLLLSACPEHPDGLLNSSGMLGRCLMDHPLVRILGIAPDIRPARDPGSGLAGGPSCIYIPRFRNIERSEPFARGYGILGAVQREGIPFIDRMGQPAQEAADCAPFIMAALGEQLPDPDNRITLDPELNDRWGIAAPHIHCAFGDNERRLLEDAREQLQEMAAAAGFETTVVSDMTRPGWMIHEVGGARMGASRDTSVVDRFNRGWDVKNVFVADGACWPSSACQNPTLTMMAVAARAAEWIVRSAKAGTLFE